MCCAYDEVASNKLCYWCSVGCLLVLCRQLTHYMLLSEREFVKTKHISKLQVFVVGKNLANNFQRRDLMACYKDNRATRWIYRGLRWI